MIEQSFIFLDRVGEKSEKNIWNQNIKNWNDFLSAERIKGINALRKGYYNRQIKQANKELLEYNAPFFSKILQQGHHWRLYDFFKDDAVFLDIETSGYYGDITVVGMYDGYETKTMVRGFNFSKEILKSELSKYKIILTFNGSSFDLPVIERFFKGVVPNVPHIDLRHVCSKVGLTGGLKKIEKELGIKRPKEVADVTGEDAVYLWQMWKSTGNKRYLKTLVQYNEEDTVNLEPLADYAIRQLWEKTTSKQRLQSL